MASPAPVRILIYEHNEVIGYVRTEDEAVAYCLQVKDTCWDYIESYQVWMVPLLKELNSQNARVAQLDRALDF